MEKLHLPLSAVTAGDFHLCWLRDPSVVSSVVSWEGRGRLTWLGKAPDLKCWE